MLAGIKGQLSRLHRDDAGKMSVEMILLIAIIALPIVIALVMFKNAIFGWFQTESDALGTEKGAAQPYTAPQ